MTKEEKRKKIESDRSWIDSPEDNNCMYEAIKKNGAMTLEEVGRRLGISFVRVRQIEQAAMRKLHNVFNTRGIINSVNGCS